jgi:hypothetical protein
MNFVIAIMTSTFSYYETKTRGLYYEVLVGMFNTLEYDNKYGFAVCSQAPFNLLILPFQGFMFYPFDDETYKRYNEQLCKILYFPVAVIVTTFFTLLNLLIFPFSYLTHLWALINSILNSDEQMDDLSEKIQRVYTILKFAVAGPFFLLYSVPVDTYVFFINMYTQDPESASEEDTSKFTEKAINILIAILNENIEESLKSQGVRITHIPFKKICLELRKRLNILEEI